MDISVIFEVIKNIYALNEIIYEMREHDVNGLIELHRS